MLLPRTNAGVGDVCEMGATPDECVPGTLATNMVLCLLLYDLGCFFRGNDKATLLDVGLVRKYDHGLTCFGGCLQWGTLRSGRPTQFDQDVYGLNVSCLPKFDANGRCTFDAKVRCSCDTSVQVRAKGTP